MLKSNNSEFESQLIEALKPFVSMGLKQKILIVISVFIGMSSLYAYLFWMPLNDDIQIKKQEMSIKSKELAINKSISKDLPSKLKEYDKLTKDLKTALSMLPKKSQIPDLLESVSTSGKMAGLYFKTFQPDKENPKTLYSEVPVKFEITGYYPQFMQFLEALSKMERIAIVRNLKIHESRIGEPLLIQGEAVTYRFIEDQSKGKGKGKKK